MSATSLPPPMAAQRPPTTNETPTCGYLGALSWTARRPLTVTWTPDLLAFADSGQ
jgi:hypothetical protein